MVRSSKRVPDEGYLESLELLLLETRLCLSTLITVFAFREGTLTGMSDEQYAERMDRLRKFAFDVDKEHKTWLARDRCRDI